MENIKKLTERPQKILRFGKSNGSNSMPSTRIQTASGLKQVK
jgi:hypothetical protein